MTTTTINTLKINGKELELEDKLARDTIGEGFNTTDKTVAKELAAEITRATSAEETLTTDLASEVSRATTAETTLQTNINTEKSRAETAEQTNATDIADVKNELNKADGLKARMTTAEGKITTIEGKIPTQATAENQLADKDFVNSSIASSTATFRGTFDSVEELPTTGVDNNDYAFVRRTDEQGNRLFDRYKYAVSEWLYEYSLNNSTFTAAQWASVNSGMTADVKASYDSHIANTDIHVTTTDKDTWTGKQDKLTAGDGITIAKVGDNLVISSDGGSSVDARVTAIENKLPITDSFGNKTVKDYIDSSIDTEEDRATTREDAIEEQVSTEKTRAEGAEATLTSNLNDEIARAKGVEGTVAEGKTLSGLIGEEATSRANADTTINSKIGEGFDATNTVAKAIADEVTARTSGDATTLSSAKSYADEKVASEKSRAEGAESTLTTNLATETSNRETADTTLQENIDSEASRATTAEGTLQSNINTEKSRAEGVESGLDTRLGTAEGNITTLTTDKADKSYVDTELAKKQNNLSEAQLDAVNSGINAVKVEAYDEHKNDTVIHITADERTLWNTVSNKADKTYVDSEISTEKSARETADTTLQTNIDTEVARAKGVEGEVAEGKTLAGLIGEEASARESADSTLTTNLAQEVTDRTNAIAQEVTDRNTAIGVETTRATNAENTLTTNLSNEVARAKGVEGEVETGKTLSGMISAEATTRANADTSINEKIGDGFSKDNTVANAISTNATAIATEKSRAEGAESTLTTNLAQEVTDRTNAIAQEVIDRDAAILVETNRAKGAEGTLTTNLASEVSNRESGDTAIKNIIGGDYTAESTVDTAIKANTTAISTEKSRAEGAESTLTSNLSSEATTREEADSAINAKIGDGFDSTNTVAKKITDEASARSEADTTLQTNIDNEASTRSSADTALGNRLTTVESYIPTDTTAENPLVNKSELDEKVAGVFKFKGSVQTYEDLPSTGNRKGDVWNVIEEHTTDPKFPAGSNVAWNGTEWDVLGGIFDLSLYAKKTYVDEKDTEIKNTLGDGFDTEDNTVAKVITAKVSAEATARANADTTLQSNIDSEVSRATTAEGTLTTNLATETSNRTTADNEINAKIGGSFSAESTVADAISANTTAISTEVTRAKAVEGSVAEGKTLAGLINEEATARANAITQEVTDRDAAILVETNRAKGVEGVVAEGKTLAGLISEEATARSNADTTLQTNITAEETRATTAENTLTSNLSAEVTRAKGVEGSVEEGKTLSGMISEEATTRSNADTTLQGNIDSEASARATGDTNTLSSAKSYTDEKVSAEATTRGNADTEINNKIGEGFDSTNTVAKAISDEATARTTGDTNTLASAKAYTDEKVSAEETRAKGVEGTPTSGKTLAEMITDETSARTTADSTLQGNIDTEESARTTADSEINAKIGTGFDSTNTVRKAVDTNASAIATEKSRAEGAESTLTTNLSNEVSARTTGDSDINAKIGGSFSSTSTVAMAISANTTAISSEASTRSEADSAINAKIGSGFDAENTVKKAITDTNTAITTEKTRAESAESTLTTNLASEVTRATNAETTINNKVGVGFDGKTITTRITEVADSLSSEITRATGVEGGLNTRLTTAETKIDTNTTNITNEVANRQIEDGKLETKISTETTARTNADDAINNKIGTGFDTTNTVAKKIADEVTARESGDTTTLSSAKTYADEKVATEKSARETADTTLQTNINNEASARATAITTEATARETGDATTLSSAKTYTDEKVASALTSVYKYKGSVQNYEALQNITSKKQGDVWNVVEEHTTDPKFPAGSNLAWVQDTEESGHWDVLGGTVDLTPYAKKEIIGNFTSTNTVESAISTLDTNKADKATTLSDYGITDAYTKSSVDVALGLKQDTLTTAQLAATNSGVTQEKVSSYDSHLTNTSNPHSVTKAQVGLGNVDNTADADKPVSTAQQTALNLKANTADLATVATSGSYNDLTDKPTIDTAIDGTSENAVQNKVIKVALDGKQAVGDYVTNATLTDKLNLKVNTSFQINGNALTGTSLSTENLLPTQSASTENYILSSVKEGDTYVAKWVVKGNVLPEQSSHNGQFLTTNGTSASWVEISKTTVGLGNVDNTSDLNKPISTATQSALDLKADKATTLAGYGITDAYTKSAVDTELDKKQDCISVYNHTYYASDWVADGDLYKLSVPVATHKCGDEPIVKMVLWKDGTVYKKVPQHYNSSTGVLDEGYTFEIDASGNITFYASTQFEVKIILDSLSSVE